MATGTAICVPDDESGQCIEAPFVKVVCRGKVNAPLKTAVDVSVNKPNVQKNYISASSRYGKVFHIQDLDEDQNCWEIVVYDWDGVEDAYSKVEEVQLKKASLGLVKETICHAEQFALLTFGENAPHGLQLSPDESFLIVWGEQEVFLYDLFGLKKGENRYPHFIINTKANDYNANVNDTPPIRGVSCNSANDLAILDDYGSLLRVVNAEKGQEKVHHQMEKIMTSVCWSPDNHMLVFGCAEGKGQVDFFMVNPSSSSEEGKLTKCYELNPWNTEDEEVESDLSQAHWLQWSRNDILAVGYRSLRNIDGGDPGPLPFVIIYCLDEEKIRMHTVEIKKAWFFDNPLDFQDEEDKPWQHTFYADYLPEWKIFVLMSSWSANIALIGEKDPDSGWLRWLMKTPAGDSDSVAPQVVQSSLWSLSDRPWMWVREDDQIRVESKAYVLGMCLVTCAQSGIPPFSILGAGRELDGEADFSPCPTVLVTTSDGIVEVVALAESKTQKPNMIQGMIEKIFPIPLEKRQPVIAPPPAKHDLEKACPVRKETATGLYFVPSDEFVGSIDGYVFRNDTEGLGYYKDEYKDIQFKLPEPPSYSDDEAREMLFAIYKQVNPEKNAEFLEGILTKYKGNYHVLFLKLESKYNIKREDFRKESQKAAALLNPAKDAGDLTSRVSFCGTGISPSNPMDSAAPSVPFSSKPISDSSASGSLLGSRTSSSIFGTKPDVASSTSGSMFGSNSSTSLLGSKTTADSSFAASDISNSTFDTKNVADSLGGSFFDSETPSFLDSKTAADSSTPGKLFGSGISSSMFGTKHVADSLASGHGSLFDSKAFDTSKTKPLFGSQAGPTFQTKYDDSSASENIFGSISTASNTEKEVVTDQARHPPAAASETGETAASKISNDQEANTGGTSIKHEQEGKKAPAFSKNHPSEANEGGKPTKHKQGLSNDNFLIRKPSKSQPLIESFSSFKEVYLKELDQEKYTSGTGEKGFDGVKGKDEISLLRRKCRSLEDELGKERERRQLQAPPELNIIRMNIDDRRLSTDKLLTTVSYTQRKNEEGPADGVITSQRKEHSKKIIKLLVDKMSKLESLCDAMYKANTNPVDSWAEEKTSFEKCCVDLRHEADKLAEYLATVSQPALHSLRNQLSALRRNYFLQEWNLQNCASVKSDFENSQHQLNYVGAISYYDDEPLDDDLETSMKQMKLAVSQFQKRIEQLKMDILARERVAENRRKQIIQQLKTANLRLFDLKMKRSEDIPGSPKNYTGKSGLDILKDFSETQMNAKKLSIALKSLECEMSMIETKLSRSTGMVTSMYTSKRKDCSDNSTTQLDTKTKQISLNFGNDNDVGDIASTSDGSNDVLMLSLMKRLNNAFQDRLKIKGPRQVYNENGLLREESDYLHKGTGILTLSCVDEQSSVEKARRREARSLRKALADALKHSAKSHVGTQSLRSLQAVEESRPSPLSTGNSPGIGLDFGKLAKAPSYTPVTQKELKFDLEPAVPSSISSTPTKNKASMFDKPQTVEIKEEKQPVKEEKSAETSSFSKIDFGANSDQGKKDDKSTAAPSSFGGIFSSPETAKTQEETVTAQAPTLPLSLDDIDMHATLKQFYSSHNPNNVSKVDDNLKKYQGREKELIAALEKKYKTTVALVKKTASTFGKSVFDTPATSSTIAPATPAFGTGSFTTAAAGTDASPAFGGTGFGGNQTQTAPAAPGAAPDYKTLLINFYQKHNASKLNTVDTVLTKYKGQESKLFDQLSRKYNTANPLVTSNLNQPLGPPSGFGAGTGFASSAGVGGGFGQAGASSTTPFGGGGNGFGGQQQNPPVFGGGSQSSTSFGGAAQTSPFGGGGTGTSMSAFGGQQQSGFGVATTTASPFGGGTPSTFGSTSAGFGAPQQQQFQDARTRLIEFYQKHNPSKLNTVDATLAKYRGREAQLFANLEKKYNVGSSGFGMSGTQQPSQSAFGSGFSGGNTGAFGAQTSVSSPFGSPQTPGPGFGNTGFGTASPFGGGNGGSGFGSTGFGASTGGTSFGQSNFSASSFSQMRK